MLAHDVANIVTIMISAAWVAVANATARNKSPGATSCCYYYLIWLGSLVLFYLTKHLFKSGANPNYDWIQLVILDIGNVAIFGAAASLAIGMRGLRIGILQLAQWSIAVGAVLVSWDVAIGVTGRSYSNLPFRALLISPSLTFSTVSMLGLTIACFVLFRMRSIPFAIIGTCYAMIQVPAYARYCKKLWMSSFRRRPVGA